MLLPRCRSSQGLHNLRGDRFDYGHHDRITKLSVRLRVRYWYGDRVRISHQASTFSRSQPSRVLSWALRNQNLRAVLVVAGTERSADVVAGDQPKAKSITGRLMLFRVVLKVVPEMVRQGVFVWYVSVQNAGELRPFRWKLRELESSRRFETDQEHTLTMLRDDA